MPYAHIHPQVMVRLKLYVIYFVYGRIILKHVKGGVIPHPTLHIAPVHITKTDDVCFILDRGGEFLALCNK